MTTDDPTYDARMFAQFGYRPSRSHDVCLRQLVGKRCLRLCAHHHARFGRTVFDHQRLWLDRDGTYVLTAEPYTAALDAQGLAQVLADAAANGLHVTATTGPGVWNAGTTLITFRARRADLLPFRPHEKTKRAQEDESRARVEREPTDLTTPAETSTAAAMTCVADTTTPLTGEVACRRHRKYHTR